MAPQDWNSPTGTPFINHERTLCQPDGSLSAVKKVALDHALQRTDDLIAVIHRRRAKLDRLERPVADGKFPAVEEVRDSQDSPTAPDHLTGHTELGTRDTLALLEALHETAEHPDPHGRGCGRPRGHTGNAPDQLTRALRGDQLGTDLGIGPGTSASRPGKADTDQDPTPGAYRGLSQLPLRPLSKALTGPAPDPAPAAPAPSLAARAAAACGASSCVPPPSTPPSAPPCAPP